MLRLAMAYHGRMGAFLTTQWSLVREAGSDTPEARAALSDLCDRYQPAIRAYLGRYKVPGMDADDLVQGFLVSLLEAGLVARASPDRGSFRAYLVAAMRRFVAVQLEKVSAQKRGAGSRQLALDEVMDDGPDPELSFRQAWAATILESALEQLAAEARKAGRTDMFDQLSPFLIETPERNAYAAIGERLGMKPKTIAVAVHRLRQRYQAVVREEVRQTLESGADLDQEMAWLRESM